MKARTKLGTFQSAGLITRLTLIGGALLLVGLLALWAVAYFELCDFRLAVAALCVCVISSLVAHIAGEYPSGDDYFAARLALSMAVRTGVPFLAVILVKVVPQIPFESGFVFLVILFYFVGLIVDVSLHATRLNTSE